jgi:hypothetical protein
MHEMDRVKKQWAITQAQQDRNYIDMLRIRADLAEAVRDAYGAGITRKQIADELDISLSRVTQLRWGNANPGRGSRKLPVAPEWSPEVQARVTRYLVATLPPDALQGAVRGEKGPPIKTIKLCKYCGDPALYRLEYGDEQTILVCGTHKPK